MDDPSLMVSQNTGLAGGPGTTPGSIASRFFGQNQREYQLQSTTRGDEEENIDEEIVNFRSAIQQFNTLSQKIQQQQAHQMSIIQRVMDDDLAAQSQHLLGAPGFRQLNPFQATNYLSNSLSQSMNPPTLEQPQRTPRLDACEDDHASAFARKSGVAGTNSILPVFMQKKGSSSKDNSGESSLPAGTQNPLLRLRQEIRNQQSNSRLYEQIQLLAE